MGLSREPTKDTIKGRNSSLDLYKEHWPVGKEQKFHFLTVLLYERLNFYYAIWEENGKKVLGTAKRFIYLYCYAVSFILNLTGQQMAYRNFSLPVQ